MTIVSQVGDVGLEMPPLTGRVPHAEDELLRLPGALRLEQACAVVFVDEPHEPVLEQRVLLAPDEARDGAARVAAAAVAQHQHEVGRGRDEAAEMGRLASCRRDERPGEEQGEQNAADPEAQLQPDRVVDVLVGLGGDRPRRVE